MYIDTEQINGIAGSNIYSGCGYLDLSKGRCKNSKMIDTAWHHRILSSTSAVFYHWGKYFELVRERTVENEKEKEYEEEYVKERKRAKGGDMEKWESTELKESQELKG